MSDLEEGEILDSDSNEITETGDKVLEEPVEIETTSTAEVKVEATNILGTNHLSVIPLNVTKTELNSEIAEFSFHESNASNLREKLLNSSQFSTRRSPQKGHQKLGKPLYKHYSDDESSATSDEDTDLWKCKKARYFSSSKEKTMDISTEITSPPRNGSIHSQNTNVAPSKGRKLNNIWGSVLVEQDVTCVFSNVGVEKLPDSAKSDRNVEAYDFTKAYEDEERHFHQVDEVSETHDPFNKVVETNDITLLEKDNVNPGLKRKRKPVKDRIQDISDWSYDEEKSRDHFGVTFEDSDAKIVNAVSIILNEPKIELLAKAVEVLGSRKILETAYLTEDVEEAGGMMTFDGYRRRTPGGVFIQLLKKNKEVTKEQSKEIFGEEERQFKKALRADRKQRKKEKRELYKNLPQSKYTQFGRATHHPHEERMDDDLNENRNSEHGKKKKKKKNRSRGERKKDKKDEEMKNEDSSSVEENDENNMDNETGEVTVATRNSDSLDGDIDLNEDADDIVIG